MSLKVKFKSNDSSAELKTHRFSRHNFYKYIVLFLAVILGLILAGQFPYPDDPMQPYLLVVMSLLFIKNWLEYLLYLPISGFRGVLIPVTDTNKRRQFFILTLAAYVLLMTWLINQLYFS